MLLVRLQSCCYTKPCAATAAAAAKAVLLQQQLLPQVGWLLSQLRPVAYGELFTCCCAPHTHQQQLPTLTSAAVCQKQSSMPHLVGKELMSRQSAPTHQQQLPPLKPTAVRQKQGSINSHN
jgi:hypothetical protein